MPPYFVAGVTARVFDTARNEAGLAIPMLALLVAFLLSLYRLYMGRLEDGRDHAEEMASLHLRTIEALALAIDAKDQTTHEHLERVQVYAVELGKELARDEEHMEAIRAASLLHDIGKLAVPEHIISKPGRLTPEEFEKMKIHLVVGAEILERVQFPYPVVPMVRYHHEKWDGSGYPEGLKGEAIPIGARILSAVDCLDALATDRQYRKALPLDQAIAVVVQEAGRAFDPEDQRSGEHLERVALLPAREFPTSPEAIAGFRGRWRERFEGDPQQCPLYRAVSAGHAPAGIEAWMPLFFDATALLADYLPATALVVDTVDLERALPLAWAEIAERYEDRRHDRERPLLAPEEAFVLPAEAAARLAAHARVQVTVTKAEQLGSTGPFHNFGSEPPPDLRIDPRALVPPAALLASLASHGDRVLLLADSAGRRELLLGVLRDAGHEPRPLPDWPAFHGGAERFAIARCR